MVIATGAARTRSRRLHYSFPAVIAMPNSRKQGGRHERDGVRLRSGQNRPVDRRRDDDPGTAIGDPTPTTPASASPYPKPPPRQIPIDGNRPHGPPRVP